MADESVVDEVGKKIGGVGLGAAAGGLDRSSDGAWHWCCARARDAWLEPPDHHRPRRPGRMAGAQGHAEQRTEIRCVRAESRDPVMRIFLLTVACCVLFALSASTVGAQQRHGYGERGGDRGMSPSTSTTVVVVAMAVLAMVTTTTSSRVITRAPWLAVLSVAGYTGSSILHRNRK